MSLARWILVLSVLAARGVEAQELPELQEPREEKALEMKTETIDGNVMEMKGDVIDGNVMEMQGDVISADRKSSPVFVEPGSVDQGAGALIFKRPNFNDFHDPQKKWRVKAYNPGGK